MQAQTSCYPEFYVYQIQPSGTLCSSQNITLRADYTGDDIGFYGEFRWYETETATTPIQTTVWWAGYQLYSDYQFYATHGKTVYFALYDQTAHCESVRQSYTVYIQPTPTLSIQYARACGDGNIQMKLSGAPTNGSYYLYKYSQESNSYQFIENNTTGLFNIYGVFPGDGLNYYARISSSCYSSSYIPVPIDVVNPLPPTISGSTLVCQGAGSTLTASGSAYAVYRWYNGSGSQVSEGTTFAVPATLTVGTHTYSVRGVSSSGCLTNPATVTVTVKTKPVDGTITADVTEICLGESVTISSSSVNAVGTPYYWCSTDGGQSWNIFQMAYGGQYSFQHTPTKPGTYRYLLRNRTACGFCWDAGNCPTNPYIDVVVKGNSYDNQNRSFITVTDIGVEGIQTMNQVCDLPVEQAFKSITYLDGLGRMEQQVLKQASPEQNDINLPVVYDALGRQTKQYLPYTGGNDGTFKSNAIDENTYTNSAQHLFYQNTPGVAKDALPYAATVFDNSPLNVATRQVSVGEAWQANGEKAAKSTYRTNTAADGIRWWQYTHGGELLGSFAAHPTYPVYPAGKLAVSETKDEDNHTVWQFINTRGEVVLKRALLTAGNYLDTYYIYDDFGQLRYVLSPEMVAKMELNNWQATATLIEQYAYRYHYDARKRLIEKYLPGAKPIYMVYNGRDEMILSQDGEQFKRNEWSFIKYDALGRTALTGKYVVEGKTRQNLQGEADGHTAQFEKREYNEPFKHYSNQAFPVLSGTGYELYTVNYYDDYDFNRDGNADQQYNTNYQQEFTENLPYWRKPSATSYVAGLQTASLVKILDSGQWLQTVTFYDEDYRPVQLQADNHLPGGKDIITTSYDFSGQVRYQYRAHTGGENVTVKEEYDYDHGGRLKAHYHQVNGGDKALLSHLEYNELGQLIRKDLHGPLNIATTPIEAGVPASVTLGDGYTAASEHVIENGATKTVKATEEIILKAGFWAKQGATFTAQIVEGGKSAPEERSVYLQSIDYRYNIRGWLTHINDPEWSASDGNDLFSMSFRYLPSATGASGYYNGNIAQIQWKSRIDNVLRSYAYGYDGLNRLQKADYSGASGGNFSIGGNGTGGTMSYDKNGNIRSLSRNGLKSYNTSSQPVYGEIDRLSYSYDGNKLYTVEDAAPANTALAGDFQDVTKQTATSESNYTREYFHDDNGNLTRDDNKKIHTISYNYLDLPKEIWFDASGLNRIVYLYDAAGTKLSKTVYTGGVPLTTHYVGAMVFEGNVLQMIHTEEGRVLSPQASQSSHFVYEYHYNDHQGNLRLLFRPGNTQLYTLTMEPQQATEEEIHFTNVAATRQINPMNARSGRASAGLSKGEGVEKVLPVSKGDKVSVEALPSTGKRGIKAYP